MSSTTEVAVPETNTGLAVPMPAMWGDEDEVTASDIKMPEIRITQSNSVTSKEGISKEGDINWIYGADDDAPVKLAGLGKTDNDSFVGYVLTREKFAATTANDSMDFHPTPHRDPNDPKSWEGWFFYVAMPGVDEMVPARMMLWKSSKQAAQAINGFIQRAKMRGDNDPIAVRFTVARKANDKGSWAIIKAAQVGLANVDQSDLQVAKTQRPLAEAMILSRRSGGSSAPVAGADQPEV